MVREITLQKSKLSGTVTVSGAKNSALRLLAASLLSSRKITIRNYPASILDAQVHVGMLERLGKKCIYNDSGSMVIKENSPIKSRLDWDGRSIRNTLLILGALTSRTGAGEVPLPGGCKIGQRPYDLHEMVLSALGASVWREGDSLLAEAPRSGLVGTDIRLPIRSTGATENAIISSVLATGITRVWNPHVRPEILDLIEYLNSMGAKIKVHGQEHISITGVDNLNGTDYVVMPDNMEAITWLVGAAITGGDVEIQHFPYKDLEVALIHLQASGVNIYRGDNSVIVRGGACYPLDISTGPHPGINSDVQPILAAFAAQAEGKSRIIDLRFPGRYHYAQEMAKMGLDYSIDGNVLVINGHSGGLKGAEVRAIDLRAGAALALCALTAEGATTIHDAWQIERGYDNFAGKLTSIGAYIT